MKVSKIAFVILPVSDIARARYFYEKVLNLNPLRVYDKGGLGMADYDTGGGLLTISCGAPMFKPSGTGNGAVALEVADFENAITHLRNMEIMFASTPMETAECHLATVADPDGNYIIIYKKKSSAAQ